MTDEHEKPRRARRGAGKTPENPETSRGGSSGIDDIIARYERGLEADDEAQEAEPGEPGEPADAPPDVQGEPLENRVIPMPASPDEEAADADSAAADDGDDKEVEAFMDWARAMKAAHGAQDKGAADGEGDLKAGPPREEIARCLADLDEKGADLARRCAELKDRLERQKQESDAYWAVYQQYEPPPLPRAQPSRTRKQTMEALGRILARAEDALENAMEVGAARGHQERLDAIAHVARLSSSASALGLAIDRLSGESRQRIIYSRKDE